MGGDRMKKIIVFVFCVFCFGFTYAEQPIPNLETSILYDFTERELVTGLTSRILSYGDFDVRVGITEKNKSILSMTFDLKDLEKLGTKINYGWSESLLVSLGIWMGYDFSNDLFGWGISTVLVEIKFNQ